MENFGKCPAPALVQWPNEVGYDCHVGISLEVYDMEIQFWEMFTPDEFPQTATPNWPKTARSILTGL
jgi:hypothetical protein